MKVIPNLRELEDAINSARSFLIVSHKNPTVDSLAASLALYLALAQAGKNVTVACSDKPTVEFSNLFGIDKIKNTLGNKNFIISLDCKAGSIEKVSYNVEGDKFNLVIQPREGAEPFSAEKVHFSQSGTNAEAIFIVDCQKLEDLDSLYTQEQEIYSKALIVNIDKHQDNKQFGKVNVVDYDASSTTEIIFQVLNTLKLTIDQDCATNILSGITWATNTFSTENIKPDTFEVVAMCLRMGGKLLGKGVSTPSPTPIPAPSNAPTPTDIPVDDKTKKAKTPPPDWLEPKIYKGSTLI
jgi:nanoRNase/pAp phosphatase (c-di-AMP/oligoRNAs hydrolase)